mmetsp:Transcript_59701/g.98537  ORF Transcript_59701/g.98537 Transcript_59701/m.98537 type:complete len:472 (+) Transcript_59701:38-1453(+)
MALFVFCFCFFVASLAQTYLSVDDTSGSLIVHNVEHASLRASGKLTIPKNKAGGIWFGSSKFVKAEKADDSYKLEFEFVRKVGKVADPPVTIALPFFEDMVMKGNVNYGGSVIKPTFSYMISAHGLEMGHKRHLGAGPDPGQTAWPYDSKLYFFSPDWTKVKISLGEQWQEWFDHGDFGHLQAVESIVPITKGTQIYGHYAAFGPEFEASSGVYRVKRQKGHWRPELLVRFPHDRDLLFSLNKIVGFLEKKYGKGDVYWNACREDAALNMDKVMLHRNDFIKSFEELASKQKELGWNGLDGWRKKSIQSCTSIHAKALVEGKKAMEWAEDEIKKWTKHEAVGKHEEFKSDEQRLRKCLKKNDPSVGLREITVYDCWRQIDQIGKRTDDVEMCISLFVYQCELHADVDPFADLPDMFRAHEQDGDVLSYSYNYDDEHDKYAQLEEIQQMIENLRSLKRRRRSQERKYSYYYN